MAIATSHMTKQTTTFLNSAWKNGSDWYVISLLCDNSLHFPILEILCCGPNYQSINQSIKNDTISWIDKELVLTKVEDS